MPFDASFLADGQIKLTAGAALDYQRQPIWLRRIPMISPRHQVTGAFQFENAD
jgi:hypothetical protein